MKKTIIILISSQFRTFNMAAYCLFSLINGDEVYSTFKKLRDKTYLVWLFSRMYIYSFIALFTYMILSLFIAIITDTYETIKVSLLKPATRIVLYTSAVKIADFNTKLIILKIWIRIHL